MRKISRILVFSVAFVASEMAAVTVWQFPYASDDALRREDALKAFYTLKYEPVQTVTKDTALARAAAQSKTTYRIRERIQAFVKAFHLERAKVLDVGSGTGYL